MKVSELIEQLQQVPDERKEDEIKIFVPGISIIITPLRVETDTSREKVYLDTKRWEERK